MNELEQRRHLYLSSPVWVPVVYSFCLGSSLRGWTVCALFINGDPLENTATEPNTISSTGQR